MAVSNRIANFILPITWIVAIILVFFSILGLYIGDMLRIVALFVSLSVFFYSYATNNFIKNTQNKINNYLTTIFEWIFGNPWKCGFIMFFILFISYGLRGFYLSMGLDVGFFLQALSNPNVNGIFQLITIDGRGASFFLNHFQPYLFFLYPIKFLPFPSVFLLSFAYIFLSLTLVFGIQFIQKNSDFPLIFKISLLLTCLSLAFWNGIACYEFHELALIPFFYLFMFISWYEKSFYKFLIFSILSLFIKETVALTFLWSGFFLFLFGKKFDRKFAMALIVLGGMVFYIYFKIILVNIKGQSESVFIGYYSSLGNTMLEVILAPVLKPILWLKALFQYKNFEYLFLVIFPVIFYLRGGWKILIFAFPTFYMVMLPQYTGLTDYKNQYGGEILIPLCVCSFYGLKYLLNSPYFQNSVIFQRSVLSLSIFAFFIFLFINPMRALKDFLKKQDSISFAYKLQAIPTNQVVITNTEIAYPFIANRSGMYMLKNLSQYSESEIKKINYFIYEGEITKDFYLPNNAKLVDKYQDFSLYKIGDK